MTRALHRAPAVAVLLLLAACSAGGAASGAVSPAAPAPSTGATTPVTGSTSSSTASATPGAKAQAPVPAEKNPPGDIPDNVAFVKYANGSAHYSLTHPEGWAQTVKGGTVTFTDKLNGVQVWPGKLTAAPNPATAKRDLVPGLATTQPAFELKSVSAVSEPAGTGVRIVYRRNSAPDPVTGRQYRDEVERYELVANGRELVVELFGPVGADNVDAYRTMVQSLRAS